MEKNDLIIKIENVIMAYDRRLVIENINLDVYKGDFMAVSGPNGGGKTTFLRILLKLLRPTRGSVRYFRDGVEVSRLAIGYLPQKNNIDVRFPVDVEDVVKSGALSWPLRRGGEDEDLFRKIVGITGISGYLKRQIGELSGGQLQRALLGRALMSRPGVLVLDEPLSYVDKIFEHQIYGLIATLAEHTTIILVSHEMSVISGMANRHIIIDRSLHECKADHHYRPAECDEYLQSNQGKE